MPGRLRRSYESGHRPKFLAVVDDTPECSRAVHFAARRAGRVGADLVLLSVIAPPESQQWLGVESLLQAEAEEEAGKLLAAAADTARSLAGIEPILVVRTGAKASEILSLIEDDEDISLLVLAASPGSDGPGPLVTHLAGKASGSFPIPIAIVPGHLADREIDALA
jgi:nucleotide-binding universal stress UspA family protein